MKVLLVNREDTYYDHLVANYKEQVLFFFVCFFFRTKHSLLALFGKSFHVI